MPSDLVIIENSTINTILLNPAITQAIPCLQSASTQMTATAAQKKSCGCRVATNRTDIYKQARICIANLRGEQLQTLKRLLDTRQIRVLAPNARGQLFQFTLK